MFERTKNGQQNRSLFLGVDYVCYVEGGGGISDRSEDSSFWSKVFSSCRPDITIRFVARGGKPELEKLASDIVNQDISGTLVAMDSDYDEILGDKISDRRVLYTFGYSWENDVFCITGLIRAHAELANATQASEEETKFIGEAHLDACSALRWPVRADLLALCAKSSILPRHAPGRIVQICQTTHLPLLKRAEVLKLIRSENLATRPRDSTPLPPLLDVARYCVGHVYAFLACAILRASHKKFVGNSLPSANHIRHVCLLIFPEMLRVENNSVVNHYRKICAV